MYFLKEEIFYVLDVQFLLFGKKIFGFDFTLFWYPVNMKNQNELRVRPV